MILSSNSIGVLKCAAFFGDRRINIGNHCFCPVATLAKRVVCQSVVGKETDVVSSVSIRIMFFVVVVVVISNITFVHF